MDIRPAGRTGNAGESTELTAREVRDRQRAQLARVVDLTGRLIEMQDAVITHRDRLRLAILQATAADRDNKRRAALLKQLSLPVQAATLASLTRSLHTLVQLQLQAYGLGPHELPGELAASGRQPRPRGPHSEEDLAAVFEQIRARVRERLGKQAEQQRREQNEQQSSS